MFETATLPRFYPQQVLRNSTVGFSGILAERSEAPKHGTFVVSPVNSSLARLCGIFVCVSRAH